MIEITLPEEVRDLVEGSIFDIEDNVDDDRLSKFLFYCPELVKVYGLAIADLKRQRRAVEKEIWHKEHELQVLRSSILLDLDMSAYKNEALRNARMDTDPEVEKIRLEIRALQDKVAGIESDIDELNESYWGFRSLRESLGDITRLRVSERRL